MDLSFNNLEELEYLERLLESDIPVSRRLDVHDQLIRHYSFTDVKRALVLLEEQSQLLKSHSDKSFEFQYHLYSAFTENQSYNYQLADTHFSRALEIAKEHGDVRQQVELYVDYSGTCINQARMNEANVFLDKANKLLDSFPSPVLQARITTREAYVNLHVSSFTRAIELFLEAEKQFMNLGNNMTLKDYYFLSLARSGLGMIYERNDNPEGAVRAFQRVVNMCEALGMLMRISWHYLNLGNAFLALHDEDSAEEYYLKAINVKHDISQNARAHAFANLGFLYFNQKKFKFALDLYDRAEHLYKTQSATDFANFSKLENWRGKLYMEQDDKKRAKKHFANAFLHAKRIDDYQQLAIVCKDIASFYGRFEEYKEAFEYLELSNGFSAIHHKNVNRRLLLELEVKYETEKRKREAEMLRLQASSLQLKALRAQMNPHFFHNALNSIQNYITSNDPSAAAKYLSKFAKLMRQSLDNSDRELISLEEEITFLEHYLYVNQKLRFGDSMEYSIEIDEDLEEDIIGVPSMIVQPYVENAIEHGLKPQNGGKVQVTFKPMDDFSILCVVEDNGIGRDAAARLKAMDPILSDHKSKGTAITKRRLDILHKSSGKIYVKEIDLVSEGGKPLGTRVEVQVPIKSLA